MASMARKKTVSPRYMPNSYRVISTSAETIPKHRPRLPPITRAEVNIIGQHVTPGEHRVNKPNTTSVRFLRDNMSTLLEPVCSVYTVGSEDTHWWPHPAPYTQPRPAYNPEGTTTRQAYQYRGEEDAPRNTRHTAHTDRHAAYGIVPVNFLGRSDGKKRLWKEKISYEHQFNSRKDPQYPMRARRHGSLVWDEMSPVQVEDMLRQHGYLKQTEQRSSVTDAAPNGQEQTTDTAATEQLCDEPKVHEEQRSNDQETEKSKDECEEQKPQSPGLAVL